MATAKKAKTTKGAKPKKAPAKKKGRLSVGQLFDTIRLGGAALSPADFEGIDIDARDADGWTLLHHATTRMPTMGKDCTALAKFLVARGASVDLAANDGKTPLMLAAVQGHLDLVQFLHERGAKLDTPFGGMNVLQLIAVTMEGRPRNVKVTVQRDGKDVELEDPDAIRAAIGFHLDDPFVGAIACARWLVEKGLRADVQHGERKQTALFSAAHHGAGELVGLFLDHGCSVEERDAWGLTPLHYACRSGSTETVALLLDRGAKLDAGDDCGFTPLHECAEQGALEIAKLLLARGAPKDARITKSFDAYGEGATARDVAVAKRKTGIADLLA